ncbi:MAG TPA: choice-of-anchor D domain-containing protein, partial [Candidatus Kapabacteria bacterium]
IPRITVDQSIVDADSVAMGQTSCKDITVSNPGSDTLRILKHYFASKDGDYSHTPLPNEPYLILPNESVKINICFTPMQKGTRVARFRILTDIPKTMQVPKQDTASIDINFSGNGIPVDLSIIAQKDVSDVVVGSEAGTPLEFTNVGTDPVVVAKPIISGANASEFTVSKVNFPLTVAPGSSVNMTLMSKPTARGERTANVLFNLVSDGRSYTASTVVKANALAACATSSATALTFDKLIIGESSANVFEVSNCGDIEQTFSATVSGSDAYSLDATSVVVPAGGKANITVFFAPKVEGVVTATLTLKGSHVNDIAVTMTGIGEKKPATASVGRTSEMDGFVLEQNAPNPALGYTNISFTSPKMASVRIYLSDMTGKMVKEVANGNYSSGSHSVKLDTKDLSSGSYIYILESNNVRLTRQMVVTK